MDYIYLFMIENIDRYKYIILYYITISYQQWNLLYYILYIIFIGFLHIYIFIHLTIINTFMIKIYNSLGVYILLEER